MRFGLTPLLFAAPLLTGLPSAQFTDAPSASSACMHKCSVRVASEVTTPCVRKTQHVATVCLCKDGAGGGGDESLLRGELPRASRPLWCVAFQQKGGWDAGQVRAIVKLIGADAELCDALAGDDLSRAELEKYSETLLKHTPLPRYTSRAHGRVPLRAPGWSCESESDA
ncbi:hypothetical protein AURDEDRAFT_163682 [Auricularia subglabra TFB-10046 SS5]|nr:hypothetical protein AURDEDRAFT_163682 [Auricularia subglabra TFB-10046 SS5]